MSRPTIMVSALACTDHDVVEDCRYQVAWQINPHMEIGAVDFHKADQQHRAFKEALVAAGADVIELPFVHGAFDCVFSKDPAVVVERRGVKKALLARLRYAERQREQAARADFYERHGFEVICENAGPSWEGGDTVMLANGRGMFLGHGPRTKREAATWLEKYLEIPVTPLELCDEHLYHLDMCLAMLADGTALVCESALTKESMLALERAPGVRHVITVPREDALAFGLNLVTVGDTVLSGSVVPRVANIIRGRGFKPLPIPLDQFHLAGGSAACLIAKLHPDPTLVDARESNKRPSSILATAASKFSHLRRPIIEGKAMDIYGPFFRSVLFPLWEKHVRHRPVIERWEELKRTQYASLDELHAMQNASLQKLVKHAYDNVPFYKRHFDAVGLKPGDIKTPKDLLKFPILRRADLKSDARDRESTVAPFPTIRKQTSGTTGEPLLFGFEPDSEHWRQAVKLRGYEWAGYRPGDRALHFWGAPLPTEPPWKKRAKITLDRAMNRDHYIQCAVMSDEKLREAVGVIEKMRPQVFVCYAQAGAELARYINRNNLRTWETIRVISGAERLLPRDRADLEEAFGPAVFDTYGCREVMLIAAECEAHHGMHVSMENLVVEIIVTENGKQRAAREGESGEVVFTDLHNFGMPFIRYANGDIATQGPTRRCSCGRTLPRITSIQGRTSETLRDANGSAVSGLALSFLFHDIAGKIRQFQAVQHKDRSVTISLVLNERLPVNTLEEIRKNGARLLTGVDVKVNVVEQLPRSAAGKHNLVVVERD